MNGRRNRGLMLLAALIASGVDVRPAATDGPGAAALPPVKAATLASLLDRALTPDQRRERAFLEHLGWRFLTDAGVTTITVAGGAPCLRPDRRAAQAAGDLRILFPTAVTAADIARFGPSLPEIADSIPTRGAWQFLMAPAVERATAKLSANAARGYWVFPQWIGLNSPIFSMDPPASEWVKQGKRIRCAREKPSAAIEAFYTERASSECYVAQSIAAYAGQYELYGAAWFDAVFAPGEIAIGQVEYFHETPLGRSMNAPEDYPWRALFLRPDGGDEDKGVRLARIGPLAFPGLTGILMDQNGSGRSRQNFTFVSVSPAAAESLVRNGGFVGFAERTHELLALTKAMRGPFMAGADLVAARARMAAVLSDPMFSGVRVYIHPFGVKTLDELIDEFRRKDRSAVELVLYDEAREDTFFQRYRRAWKARVGGG